MLSSATKILKLFKKEYPDPKIALEYSNPLELLVATILSAQCTDVRVNIVTKTLFKKYKTAAEYARADLKVFEQEIHSAGFYHSKAKNIIAAAKMIEDSGGKVPAAMEELIKLPGVARKTANIVLFDGFGKIEGVAVDTHVLRLSQRLGLSKNDRPEKIERDLMKLFDKKDWGILNHLLVDHGRRICDAKKPRCPECVLRDLCPSHGIFYPSVK
jgi:endonuclease-3